MSLTSSADEAFLKTVESWLASGLEVLILIRYSRAAGDKSFEFYTSFAALQERLSQLPAEACITVFRVLNWAVSVEYAAWVRPVLLRDRASNLLSSGSSPLHCRALHNRNIRPWSGARQRCPPTRPGRNQRRGESSQTIQMTHRIPLPTPNCLLDSKAHRVSQSSHSDQGMSSRAARSKKSIRHPTQIPCGQT